MMAETYENFMIFGMESTGEKVKLDISEEDLRANNGEQVLDPNQVLVIVKENLRRIFIWKGVNSHVRKKFIASRIAADLQNDLVVNGRFHRCKIISVDQGDEPKEFMRAFNFKEGEVPELLERDSKEFKDLHTSIIEESVNKNDKKVHGWKDPAPKLNEKATSHVIVKNVEEKSFPKHKQSFKSYKLDDKKIIANIINNEVPVDFKRQNLILGNFHIYGAAIKKAKVFGKDVEEIEWEQVNSIPEGPIELTNRTIRLYTNSDSGTIEGLEILQRLEAPKIIKKIIEKEEIIDYNSWTVSKLKLHCKENNIHVPSNYKKAQIIKLVQNGSPQEKNDQKIDYNKWTVKRLKEYCKKNNLKTLSSYRKADLVKLVKQHQK